MPEKSVLPNSERPANVTPLKPHPLINSALLNVPFPANTAPSNSIYPPKLVLLKSALPNRALEKSAPPQNLALSNDTLSPNRVSVNLECFIKTTRLRLRLPRKCALENMSSPSNFASENSPSPAKVAPQKFESLEKTVPANPTVLENTTPLKSASALKCAWSNLALPENLALENSADPANRVWLKSASAGNRKSEKSVLGGSVCSEKLHRASANHLSCSVFQPPELSSAALSASLSFAQEFQASRPRSRSMRLADRSTAPPLHPWFLVLDEQPRVEGSHDAPRASTAVN